MNERLQNLLRSVAANRVVARLLKYTEGLKYMDSRVWDHEGGNRRIYEAVLSASPVAIGKLGSCELGAIRSCLRYHRHQKFEDLTIAHRQSLFTNAGVFPDNCDTLEKFTTLIVRHVLPEMDLMGVWFNIGEARIVKKYCQNPMPVRLGSFSAYLWSFPWTKALKGKRVLVVHPFVKTIRQQFLRRKYIWSNNPEMLPEFELDLLQVPVSPALMAPKYESWFETLDALKNEMGKKDFDIALIGAGAYSLPLVVHAKHLGKIGIHTGGETQFFFGIKGGRWDYHPLYNVFYNDYWIRPLPEETSPNNKVIENGCYW